LCSETRPNAKPQTVISKPTRPQPLTLFTNCCAMGNDLKTMTRQPTFGTYVFDCLRTCQRIAKYIRAKFSNAQQRIHLWINRARNKYFINTEIEKTGENHLFTFDIIHKARSKLRCRFILIDKECFFCFESNT
jgi:hypothetical protein